MLIVTPGKKQSVSEATLVCFDESGQKPHQAPQSRSSHAGSQTGKSNLIKQPVQTQELQNNEVMNKNLKKETFCLGGLLYRSTHIKENDWINTIWATTSGFWNTHGQAALLPTGSEAARPCLLPTGSEAARPRELGWREQHCVLHA